jgi:hypothetical protein
LPAIGTLLLAIIATPEKLTDVSRKAVSWRLQRRTTLTLDDLAKEVNPVLRGCDGANRNCPEVLIESAHRPERPPG